MNFIDTSRLNFELLYELTGRPTLYERSTDYIWTNDHIGRQMLRLHLDPEIDSASLKHSTIDRQVQWITQQMNAPTETKLLDIGCGPGLFCERFSFAGLEVTGMDFNRHSLTRAKQRAQEKNLDIKYLFGDYNHLESSEEYDVVTLINRDFSALTEEERENLLSRVHRSLAPGGLFILDMLSSEFFATISERRGFQVIDQSGFWSNESHLILEETLLFRPERVQLDHYIVIGRNGDVRNFFNWLTYFEPSEVEQSLTRNGFTVVESNPYLSDLPYCDPKMNLGYVAMKV